MRTQLRQNESFVNLVERMFERSILSFMLFATLILANIFPLQLCPLIKLTIANGNDDDDGIS